MILTIAIVALGIDLVIEGLKYVSKKTKTKYDDKAVEFVEDNKSKVVGYVANKLGAQVSEAPKAPRERVIDHRPGK